MRKLRVVVHAREDVVDHFKDVDGFIDKFNNLLYQGTETQRDRKIEIYKDHIYITGTKTLLLKLLKN
jgi:hypothetical protein